MLDKSKFEFFSLINSCDAIMNYLFAKVNKDSTLLHEWFKIK
jgi:hypothetical protein